MTHLPDSNLSTSNLKQAGATICMMLSAQCIYRFLRGMRSLVDQGKDVKKSYNMIGAITSYCMAIRCLNPKPTLPVENIRKLLSITGSILGQNPLSHLDNMDHPYSDEIMAEIVFVTLMGFILGLAILESCLYPTASQTPAAVQMPSTSDKERLPEDPPITRGERRRARRSMASVTTPAMPLSESLRTLKSEYDTIKTGFEVGVDVPNETIKKLERTLEGVTIRQEALEKKQERIKNAKAALNREIISLQGKVNAYEKAINTYQERAFPHETDQLDELRSKVDGIRQRLEKVQKEMCPPDVPARA